VFKWIIKTNFVNSSHFALLILHVKILSNIQNEWCKFGRKKNTFEKNKDCPLSSFVSNLEHVNFAINEKYSKNNYDNPNYYVSLVIFQTYKNVVLKSGSFDYDFTLCFHERSNIATWELRRNLKRNFKERTFKGHL
jgi:hypothetical protein